MIEHMVFFKFNDNLTIEKEKKLLEKLRSFQTDIPGILELTAGINEEEKISRGYTLGLRVTFESREAFEDYFPHPAHKEFVRSLKGFLEHAVIMDYPITKK